MHRFLSILRSFSFTEFVIVLDTRAGGFQPSVWILPACLDVYTSVFEVPSEAPALPA